MTRGFLESPYGAPDAAGRARNRDYARICMMDSLERGEAPFPSHLLYPQVLDDTDTADRARGLAAGDAWRQQAELVVVYEDFGISSGMYRGVSFAVHLGLPIEYRKVDSSALPRPTPGEPDVQRIGV